jgi:hypothetical protein
MIRLLKGNSIAKIPPIIKEEVANNFQINTLNILIIFKLKKAYTNLSLFIAIEIVPNHFFQTQP